MVKKFPEIERFFKQDFFSEEDLLKLKEGLANTYPDKDVLKKAFSLIDLFLLKFNLSSSSELKTFREQGFVDGRSTKINQSGKASQELLLPPGWTDRRALDINCYKGVPLIFICKYLKISRILLKRNIEQAGIDNKLEKSLTVPQFEAVKPLLQKRILIKFADKLGGGALKLDKKISSIKSSNRSTKEGRYDEVAKYGLGKLIYIRSK